MKRRIASDGSIEGSFKRRNSSLFSIDTLQEDSSTPLASRPSSEVSLVERQERMVRNLTRCPRMASSPYTTETEMSEALEGFFIEDDDTEEGRVFLNKGPDVRAGLGKYYVASSFDSRLVTLVQQRERVVESARDLCTGLVFQVGLKHFDRHNRLHKERPARITSIRQHLQQCNLQDRCQIVEEGGVGSPENLFLDDDDFLRVHLPGYIQRLDKLSTCTCCNRLDHEAEQFKSIYLTPDSVMEAKLAATLLCRLVSKVVQGDLHNGFAVIRPPGHHAEPGLAGGYCILNNVAVAAAFAREKLAVQRILIVDWDVHHGNGTQSVFQNDSDVLYFSVHRWHGGNFYPFLKNGGSTNIGLNKGAGYNINVGWTRKGMGDDEYLAVWEKLLMPVAAEYKPDLVLVSAGFDAALGDMGECHVTPECFGRLTRSLMTLANGKVVCTLEGGYVRSVLGKCVELVVNSLLDPSSVDISEKERRQDAANRNGVDVLDTIDATAAKNIRATVSAHHDYWACVLEAETELAYDEAVE